MDRASDSGSECWGFESLRAYQARIGRKAYPSFFIFITAALCCQSGFVSCTRLLGKEPAAARRIGLRFGFGRTKKKDICTLQMSFFFGFGGQRPPHHCGAPCPTEIDTVSSQLQRQDTVVDLDIFAAYCEIPQGLAGPQKHVYLIALLGMVELVIEVLTVGDE